MLNAMLNAEAPLWLNLIIFAALGWLGWTTKKLRDRVNTHAESIGAIDQWADVVDENLAQFRRPRPPPKKPSTLVRGFDRPRGY